MSNFQTTGAHEDPTVLTGLVRPCVVVRTLPQPRFVPLGFGLVCGHVELYEREEMSGEKTEADKQVKIHARSNSLHGTPSKLASAQGKSNSGG